MLALSLPDAGRLNDEYARPWRVQRGPYYSRAGGRQGAVDSEANAAEMENHRTRPS